jgi:GT2 family glycosyltransferase
MNICVIIVTYGSRFVLLKKTLNALTHEAIKQIVIIDNGSNLKKNDSASIFFKQISKQIDIVDMVENTGSAKGFKTGIEKALEGLCDNFFILDDDNLINTQTIPSILHYWNKLITKENIHKTALLGNRVNRPNFLDAILTKNPEAILQRTNNYMGFHWAEMLQKIKERLFKTLRRKNITSENLSQCIKVSAASYGGLFFHRSLLKTISLPDEKYYLYSDDLAFTYPITQLGGEIWLIKDIMIEDIEQSVYLPKNKKWLHHTLFDTNESKAYYILRNMVYFNNQYRKPNNIIYQINKLSFLIIIHFFALFRCELKKLNLLYEVQNDVLNNNMGFNSKYQLN